MDKQISLAIKASAMLFIAAVVSGTQYNWNLPATIAVAISPQTAYAADAQGGKSPYGGARDGLYGEKKEVTTAEEAKRVLKDYFIKKDVKIGEVTEKELYFEAEIRDNKDNLIDKVIIDKRTGRIRSIY